MNATKERQAWCCLQVKLCDPCLSALDVPWCEKALYKYSSFPFLYLARDELDYYYLLWWIRCTIDWNGCCCSELMYVAAVCVNDRAGVTRVARRRSRCLVESVAPVVVDQKGEEAEVPVPDRPRASSRAAVEVPAVVVVVVVVLLRALVVPVGPVPALAQLLPVVVLAAVAGASHTPPTGASQQGALNCYISTASDFIEATLFL